MGGAWSPQLAKHIDIIEASGHDRMWWRTKTEPLETLSFGRQPSEMRRQTRMETSLPTAAAASTLLLRLLLPQRNRNDACPAWQSVHHAPNAKIVYCSYNSLWITNSIVFSRWRYLTWLSADAPPNGSGYLLASFGLFGWFDFCLFVLDFKKWPD